ncbi:lysylphosphatidylglycerol synthase transmembrane domain-containing protein [Anoxynatronum sibiricum]|uniref:Phosphatidylglycerol lysyltransferase n=1 Tax=Anoxynatronum sibiricum TaxID=210623 RepID=A0ABU9VVN7_9CLOT
MKRNHWISVLGLVLLLLLLWRTDLQQVVSSLRELSLTTLIVLLSLQTANRILVAYQWQHLADINHRRVTLMQMVRMNLVGTFFEGVTPSVKFGGEAVKVWWFKEHLGWSGTEATSLLILQKSISGLVFGAACVVTLISLMLHPLQGRLISSLFPMNAHFGNTLPWVVLLLTVGLLFWGISKLKTTRGIGQWLRQTWQQFISDTAALLQHPAKGIQQLILSLIIWGNYALQAWVASKGLGIPAGFLTVAAATYMAYMAGMIPLFPGGAGTFEGAMMLVLTGYGIAVHQALALTLVVRTFTFWLVFGVSALAMLIFWLADRYRAVTHPTGIGR